MIKSLKIVEHPLFVNDNYIFSVPDGSSGSGINYIVGKSGCGKTKFIETFIHVAADYTPLSCKTEIKDENGGIQFGQGIMSWVLAGAVSESQKDYFSNTDQYHSNLDGSSDRYSLDNSGNKFSKNIRSSGTGEARFNYIMDRLKTFADQGIKTIVIEEPEANLDPVSLISLLRKIGEMSKSVQFFITTHSPYIVDWNYLANGASIIKITKNINEDGKNVSSVGVFSDKIISNNIANYSSKTPHLAGVETKNVFFSDKILVVEGHEDVGLILSYLENKSIDCDFVFFGFGAGGSNKIINVLRLCSKLGVKRVVALYDSAPETSDRCYNECIDEFGSSYKVIKLLATDVRDKSSYGGKPEKFGAFDECGNLKNDECGNDFEDKIESIITYFK